MAEDEGVPFFGSWRRIYIAVIVTAAGWIALSALLSGWNF